MSNWVAKNGSLSRSEMIHNAGLLYQFLARLGWSTKAIAATMGNIQWESGINPGRWEVGKTPYTPTAGYGLVQWTPYTKYSRWAGANWENNGDKQCERIAWEWRNNKQWNRHMPVSWDEYVYSDESVSYLTEVWLRNYEVGETGHLQNRIDYAYNWYEWITGEQPYPEDPYPEPPDKPDVEPPPSFLGVELWYILKMNDKRKGWRKCRKVQ